MSGDGKPYVWEDADGMKHLVCPADTQSVEVDREVMESIIMQLNELTRIRSALATIQELGKERS